MSSAEVKAEPSGLLSGPASTSVLAVGVELVLSEHSFPDD